MKITIEWTYHHKGLETTFRSDEMPPVQALLIAEELKKTGKVKHMTFIDQYDSTWSVKK